MLQHLQFNVAYVRALISKARSEEGASAVEYGLLVAGIAALIVLVVFLFGGMIANVFDTTCSTIQGSGTAGGSCS